MLGHRRQPRGGIRPVGHRNMADLAGGVRGKVEGTFNGTRLGDQTSEKARGLQEKVGGLSDLGYSASP